MLQKHNLIILIILLSTNLLKAQNIDLVIDVTRTQPRFFDWSMYSFIPATLESRNFNEPVLLDRAAQSELSGTNLNILLQTSSDERIPLELPENVRKRLLRFIENNGVPPHQVCDCHCFSTYLGGLSYPHTLNGEYDPIAFENTTIRKLEENEEIRPGDVLVMAKSVSVEGINGYTMSHSIVYLGEGLFISRLGDQGDIVVSNFSEIRRLYNTDTVLIAERSNSTDSTTYTSPESATD